MDEKKALECPCTGDCGRHGNCALCVAHHREVGSLTACMKPIATALQSAKEGI
jgi:hypothetical protein